MVDVKYINGDSEVFETMEGLDYAWEYLKDSRSYVIPAVEGSVEIPRESVQRMRHIKVD